jgi:hypothetical protein
MAETVGTPTLLQRLTGEWPTQRLVGEAGPLSLVEDPPARRDLWRFLAWASRLTPQGSKRALIVLGDVLQAIGEAPKLFLGDYRPPYPPKLMIRKTQGSGTTKATYTYTYTYSKDAVNSYAYVSMFKSPTTAGDPSSPTPPTTSQTFSQLLGTLTETNNFEINFDGDAAYAANVWYKKNAGTDASKRAYDATDGSTTWTVDIADSPSSAGDKQVSLTRSLDAVGPADLDLATRRVDALAAALQAHHVDLLASDNRELAQLGAPRQLASLAKVLLGGRGQLLSPGQPLTALLEALRSGGDSLGPEDLAKAAVEAVPGAVGLRCSKVEPLLAALDDVAREALAGADVPERGAIRSAWDPVDGGDIAGVIAGLQSIGSPRASQIESRAAAMVIGPASAKGGDIGLGRGLQLGPTSPWTNLLDALGGYGDVGIVRSTLADLQSLTNSARRAQRAAPRVEPVRVLEYVGPGARDELSPPKHFAAFLQHEFHTCAARHVVLVVRGKWSPERPGSVSFDDRTSLSITALAGRLRAALDRRGRGPLALLVFEDAELLRIENAYELRELVRCLVTAEAGKPLPTIASLERRALDVIARCEERAAAAVAEQGSDAIAPLVDGWRHDVAQRLAKLLMFPDPDEPRSIALQGIDLSGIDALCRLFDRLCDRMFDNLGDPLVLSSIAAGKSATSLLEWINKVQMEGFYPNHPQKGTIAETLYDEWGQLYNWLSQSAAFRRDSKHSLWLLPTEIDDRDPAGYAARLRMSVGPNESKDFRSLSFHRMVSFHALLTAARVLERGGREQWPLISLGLTLSSNTQRREGLETLVGEPGAADYFQVRSTPALLRLAIDKESDNHFDVRLSSTEAQATLLRRRSVMDPSVIARSLEGLAYVMSRSMASREGAAYLQGIGSSLAEDVVSELRSALVVERKRLLARGGEAHLALSLPRELMRHPWELMQLPDAGGKLVMLAEHFAVGRQMWTDREVRRGGHQGGIRMLIVANPKTSLGPDLPAARAEGQALVDLCVQMTRELHGVIEFVADASIDETLTRTVLRQRLRSGSYDVIHFAGHGDFDAKAPDRSGWALSDGMLTVNELTNTLSSCESPPWLIYANACGVGMIDTSTPGKQYHGDVYGMAEGCIRAGVGAYIAPLWRIHDTSAGMLSREFYRRLLLERDTLGGALLSARVQTRKAWEALRGDTGLGDMSWAGLVLYGSPTARIRDIVE